eukprot:CAMPEP_0170646338 /NCGR_PEP_ID=MMETSP0224-20130122/43584_1 /TAXON_ID=285029 /ORGANISM="Togula jolla, Strain CCCM 725" /LENGTH=45 /DNA_ID= /DNA_START= /DNA_END= /DNA_ORIENTATION=
MVSLPTLLVASTVIGALRPVSYTPGVPENVPDVGSNVSQLGRFIT